MPRIEAYAHQVGGHCQIVKPAQSSKIFKPFNQSEHDFYEALAATVSALDFHTNAVAVYSVKSDPSTRRGPHGSPPSPTYLLSYKELLARKLPILDASLAAFCQTLRCARQEDKEKLAALVASECVHDIRILEFKAPSSATDALATTTAGSAPSASQEIESDTLQEEAPSFEDSFAVFLRSNVAFEIARTYPLHVLKSFFLPRYHGSTEVQLRSTLPTMGRSCYGCSGSKSCTTPPSCWSSADAATRAPEVRLENVEDAPFSFAPNGAVAPMLHLDTNSAAASRTRPGKTIDSESAIEFEVLEYIVLEDLVNGYRRPCVLDLKMGRRQKKLGASDEKLERQKQKSLRTTSYALGFRLCGCKVYDKKNDVLYCRDKYWGRELKVHQVRDSIKQFFCDGYHLDFGLTESLMMRLKILYECIKNLPRFRFWSSSLLWVVDGGVESSGARLGSLNVKMIDFTNTVVLEDSSAGPDMEYLYGLENLIRTLELILAERQVHHITT